MKSTRRTKRAIIKPDDLLPEYDFDFRKSKPNRFAGKMDVNHVVVILDKDISRIFTTSESVNNALRALISAMPAKSKQGNVRRTSASH